MHIFWLHKPAYWSNVGDLGWFLCPTLLRSYVNGQILSKNDPIMSNRCSLWWRYLLGGVHIFWLYKQANWSNLGELGWFLAATLFRSYPNGPIWFNKCSLWWRYLLGDVHIFWLHKQAYWSNLGDLAWFIRATLLGSNVNGQILSKMTQFCPIDTPHGEGIFWELCLYSGCRSRLTGQI